jgi:anti-sigma regulatory factor (Ser/Thr protein kinase)
MMGQLRNALRAFAFEHTDPQVVVSRLGRLVDGMMEVPFATLAYLVVDPRTREVRYVVAGHPPPLVRAPDGTTRFLNGGRTLPIGVDATLAFDAGDAQLAEGSTIVLYTDGLVERRGRPLDEGLRLLAGAATGTDDDPEELVDALVAALIGEDERPDDIAVLALRLAVAAVDDLRLVRPSTQESLVEMRQSLRSWLAGAGVEEVAAAEIALAVWEAGANAIEHAQQPTQPTFELTALLDDAGWARFEVRDSGTWKQGDGSFDRGLGLTLIRSFMDTVEVLAEETGTTIVMERRVELALDV